MKKQIKSLVPILIFLLTIIGGILIILISEKTQITKTGITTTKAGGECGSATLPGCETQTIPKPDICDPNGHRNCTNIKKYADDIGRPEEPGYVPSCFMCADDLVGDCNCAPTVTPTTPTQPTPTPTAPPQVTPTPTTPVVPTTTPTPTTPLPTVTPTRVPGCMSDCQTNAQCGSEYPVCDPDAGACRKNCPTGQVFIWDDCVCRTTTTPTVPVPTRTPTPTVTLTPPPGSTPTPTPTITPTPRPGSTNTPIPTPTEIKIAQVTNTPAPTLVAKQSVPAAGTPERTIMLMVIPVMVLLLGLLF